METFWQDVKYGARMLMKNRGFTIVAVLTLALGIGANSAIFSVVNAVLLRPLPYAEPERLVFLSEWSQQVPGMSISMANFNDWRAMNTVFESMVAYRTQNTILTGLGEPERLLMRQMTAGFFPTLKVQPMLGRSFTPEEDKVGAERVVLLGEGFWARRFGRDPNVLGKTLTLNGETFTVIGVLSSASLHSSLRQFDLFASLWRLEDRMGGPTNRGNHPGIYAYARLKPGVTVEQAQSEMKSIAQRLEQQYPDTNTGNSIVVQGLLDAIVEDVRPGLLVLLAAVGIYGVMSYSVTQRRHEIGIRVALGAQRGDVFRLVLSNGLVLMGIGVALGTGIAIYAARFLRAMLFQVSAHDLATFLSIPLVLATVGLVACWMPARRATRVDPIITLRYE